MTSAGGGGVALNVCIVEAQEQQPLLMRSISYLLKQHYFDGTTGPAASRLQFGYLWERGERKDSASAGFVMILSHIDTF